MIAALLAATVTVGPGIYRPMFPASPDEAEVAMPAFRLDATPVTNAEFQGFVTAHPEWGRDRISPLLAGAGYLDRWAAPDAIGDRVDPDAPVVQVSWFAARAFCASEGANLPTVAQWEFAAAASEISSDARRDPAFIHGILEWYSQPTPARLPPVGRGRPNAWGVYDLHGLVWEWTLDFDSEIVGQDALACGGGSGNATDPADYAAFMRTAMRTSLHAADSTSGLGFRCVWPEENR